MMGHAYPFAIADAATGTTIDAAERIAVALLVQFQRSLDQGAVHALLVLRNGFDIRFVTTS